MINHMALALQLGPGSFACSGTPSRSIQSMILLLDVYFEK